MLKKRRIKFLSSLLLVVMMFSVWNTVSYAGFDNGFIDPSILDKEISAWNSSDLYEKGDLVIYENKIYYANTSLSGNIPGKDLFWECKADLNGYEQLSGSELSLSNGSPLSRKSVRVVEMNIAL